MFSYTAYGLDIESEIRLSALSDGSHGRDVEIRRGKVDFPEAANGKKLWFTATHAWMRDDNIGAMRVSRGTEIVFAPAAGGDDRAMEFLILGPALAILLHQRGLLVLHASAVAVNGGVVAFLGNSGWGKSTMAAALANRGHALFADDIVPVSLQHRQPIVFPGFPRLKLRLDSAETLGYPGRNLPPLLPDDARREIVVEGVPERTSMPLEHVYVLTAGDRPAIERLSPQKAAVELIRHSYTVCCLKTPGDSAAHLRQCATLVNRLPVRRLRRPVRLELIQDVARLVERDLVGDDDDNARTPEAESGVPALREGFEDAGR